MFHPKIFCFRTGRRWEVLIGSANLTKGAFTTNSEATLHITDKDAPTSIWDDTNKLIDEHWGHGNVVTQATADDYRGLWSAQQASLRRLSGKYNEKGKFKAPADTEVMTMSWGNFFSAVSADPHHGFTERCELLALVRKKFESTEHFSELPENVRKTIAGLPKDFSEHWAWFGSMSGAGYYHQAVNSNNIHISNALDEIPLNGGILEQHYKSFITEFKKAFQNGGHGVASASRLLALKHPDYFVCLDGKNRELLCNDFGIKKSGMNYDRYWNEVINPIMDSVWWNTTAPSEQNQFSVWTGRAAMLDALFYQP